MTYSEGCLAGVHAVDVIIIIYTFLGIFFKSALFKKKKNKINLIMVPGLLHILTEELSLASKSPQVDWRLQLPTELRLGITSACVPEL